MGSSTSRSVTISAGGQSQVLSTLDGRLYKSPSRFVVEKELVVSIVSDQKRHFLCSNNSDHAIHALTIPVDPDMKQTLYDMRSADCQVYLDIDLATKEYIFQSFVFVDDD